MSVAVQQPLDFAPVELRAHGLRDAHSFPLVGSRTAEGVRSWRMPASPQTWGYPLVEWSRTGNSYAALGFDCDSREAVELGGGVCDGLGGSSDSECLRDTQGERTRASLLSARSSGSPWRPGAGEATRLPCAGWRSSTGPR